VVDGSVGETVIEARGITHLIRFSQSDPAGAADLL
jgi:hypothetical protein